MIHDTASLSLTGDVMTRACMPREKSRAARPVKLGRRAYQVLRLMAHARGHLGYWRELRAARRAGIADADRLTAVKYLGAYLSSSLTLRARRDCLRFHYRFLADAMRSSANGAVWRRETQVWSAHIAGGPPLRVTLGRSTLAPMEGESELCFMMGDRTLCTLTFAFVHGRDLQLPCSEAIFIGGLQGGLDCRQQIRDAAKLNGEISPAAMLLLAAEAIANVLGVDHMVGVSTDEQAAAGYAVPKIALSYDRLWQERGAHHVRTGFYVKAIAAADDADKAVAGSHPSRTRRRRVLKKMLRRDIEQRMILFLGSRSGRVLVPDRVATVDHDHSGAPACGLAVAR